MPSSDPSPAGQAGAAGDVAQAASGVAEPLWPCPAWATASHDVVVVMGLHGPSPCQKWPLFG